MKNDNYIEEAYKEALKAKNINEVPVGAVVVRNGKIIAKAHNLKEKNNCSIYHAEIIAINKACKKKKDWHLNDCDLYVTLEPCLMCVGALINCRIRKVYYGAKDLKTGALGGFVDIQKVKKFNWQFDTQFLNNEKCSLILKKFFSYLRDNK